MTELERTAAAAAAAAAAGEEEEQNVNAVTRVRDVWCPHCGVPHKGEGAGVPLKGRLPYLPHTQGRGQDRFRTRSVGAGGTPGLDCVAAHASIDGHCSPPPPSLLCKNDLKSCVITS